MFAGAVVGRLLCNLTPQKLISTSDGLSVRIEVHKFIQNTVKSGYSQISFSHLHPHSFSLTSCPSWDQLLMLNSPC